MSDYESISFRMKEGYSREALEKMINMLVEAFKIEGSWISPNPYSSDGGFQTYETTFTIYFHERKIKVNDTS